MTALTDAPPDAAPEAPVEHLDVIVVGAGLSGVGAASRLRQSHPGKSFAVLEMRGAIGGTWDLFRYPGVRSDSDMFTLGYSFAPWTEAKAIADGPSILEYIRRTAREQGVDGRIRYHHKVLHASWDTATSRWTVDAERTDTGERVRLTCGLLWSCGGYYSYDAGYTPEWPGRDDFQGTVVHPQSWPQDLDVTGKRVVVIGSGATAVTLVPALVKQGAAHVTMLQRSPSYVATLPSRDVVADALRKVLPGKVSHPAVRWKNVLLTTWSYRTARSKPERTKRFLRRQLKKHLPATFDMKHFTPRYEPWDQRLCLVPDADLFKALGSGRADVVTDTIERWDATGIRTTGGQHLEADVVVTATGLRLQPFGGFDLDVDGEPVRLNDHVAYKGAMLDGIPNMVFTIGYTNASWTLKADLVADLVVRLLSYEDQHGYAVAVPVRQESDELAPLIEMTSGYFSRSVHLLPQQGAKAPWRLNQDYLRDIGMFRKTPIDDGALRFLRAGQPLPARSTAPVPAGATTVADLEADAAASVDSLAS